jgi:hypothetical protein
MRPDRTSAFADAAPVGGRGQRLPQTLEAISLRNRLLVEAAALFMPGQSALMQAQGLHRAICRYAQGGWRRHRTSDQCPERLVGRVEGHCFAILRVRDATLSVRSIRRVLTARQFSWPTLCDRLRVMEDGHGRL